MKRSEFLKLAAFTPFVGFALVQTAQAQTYLSLGKYPFVLPEFGFAYDALAPRMSAATLEVHHKTLHQGYVTNLNRVLSSLPDWQGMDLADLVQQLAKLPQNLQADVRWFAGGDLNHRLFWRWLGKKPMSQRLQKALTQQVPLAALRDEFISKGMGIRGSGWVWVVLVGGQVQVVTTEKQDNPLMFGQKPILGCDVFEHSYFLDYKAGRRAYLEAFWDELVNWEFVETLLDA
jgi:superoxide dismutase, Fe-Mn family